MIVTVLLSAPELSYADGVFTIVDGQDTVTVPLSSGEPPVPVAGDKLSLEVGGTLITFDQRGLGIRYGNKGGFTGLGYMPTTSKLFTPEEIVSNVELIESGERQFRVSALSGFEVVEGVVYLWLRWDGKDDAPWLETLVSIDTSGDAPSVNLIGRFNGFSFTRGAVADELHSIGGSLMVMTRSQVGFGVGEYDVESREFAFRLVAGRDDVCRRVGDKFYAMRRTETGMTTVGIVDPIFALYRPIIETRSSIVRSNLSSALVLRDGDSLTLLSIDSGARRSLPAGAAYAETDMGVLVWSPADDPTSAELIEPGGWSVVAAWAAGSSRR